MKKGIIISLIFGLFLFLGGCADDDQVEQLKQQNSLLQEQIKQTVEDKVDELYAQFTIENIKKAIPTLYKGVKYEDIIAAVNNIQNSETKKNVINNLLYGNVKGAQLAVGMSDDYNISAESLADGYLGTYTLNYFKAPFSPVIYKPTPIIKQETSSNYNTTQTTSPSNYDTTNYDTSDYDTSSNQNSCCKICSKGKACGDSCISRSYTCHKGPGCACDG